MANGLAHPKDLPSSSLILNGAQWPTQAKSPDDRKWLELQEVSDPYPHVLQARLPRLAVEREVSSYPGRILASRRKQLRPEPPTWEERETINPARGRHLLF